MQLLLASIYINDERSVSVQFGTPWKNTLRRVDVRMQNGRYVRSNRSLSCVSWSFSFASGRMKCENIGEPINKDNR